MFKVNASFLFAILLVINSCTQKNSETKQEGFDLNKLNWLLNQWSSTTNDGVIYEVWTKASESTFAGRSFMLSGTDTVFSETIQIVNVDSGLFYIPTVKGQNKNEPVSFKLITSNDSSFVFENLAHDFPQRIIYTQRPDNILYARIEGKDKGNEHKEEFFFKK